MKNLNPAGALLVLALLGRPAAAQEALPYQLPPKPLADLVNTPPTPAISPDSRGQYVLVLERAANPSIAELSQPELRLAGVRMNPANNGPSRQSYLTGLRLRKLSDTTTTPVRGLPAGALISQISWSPDDRRVAFLNHSDDKVELYVMDVATATARRLTDRPVNALFGGGYSWVADGSLLVKALVAGRPAAPTPDRVPPGPVVQQNMGTKGQAPTYQDLLKNPADERTFEYYANAQLLRISPQGQVQEIGKPMLLTDMSASPDGRYVLTESIHRPFSYLVPLYYFPTKVELFAITGQPIKVVHDNPLVENAPWGSDATVPHPRSHSWRADAPATLCWVEARDGGDPRRKVAVRDEVMMLEAPFTAEPRSLYASRLRFAGIQWGDATRALVTERWWQNRRSLTRLLNPTAPADTLTVFDRSFEDRYSDPGRPTTRPNQYGREVLDLLPSGELYYLNATGASPEGDRPFVSLVNLKTRQSRIVWRSEAPYFEMPVTMLNSQQGLLLTRREALEESPNYFLRSLASPKKNGPVQVTFFPNPYPQLRGIHKQVLRYKRTDGTDLTATLYLPAGYKKEDGPLPTLLWAYPAEFKSKDAASQVSGSPYRFNAISYWGAPAFVTMGYAVLDNASIPIIGEGSKEPNDTYVEQLVSSAKAAIDEGVKLGVVDARRVGVGGHSYGAFMTANLLTHSNLFRAGIARSGAYNRTLTPFGFQNEQRTYWQAPQVYNTMSPFMNADKMKTPLLLIHGEADNNTGTFPIQSERYYNALKGMGATVRFVLLPYESHGYAARESLLHMLWEMNNWLDRYVRNPEKQ